VLLHLRARAVEAGVPAGERALMRAAAWTLGAPRRLRAARGLGRLAQRLVARDGAIRRLPPPLAGWTRTRDLKTLPAESFRSWWRRR
jgi:L-lactate dehydrogenase complex protein LldF